MTEKDKNEQNTDNVNDEKGEAGPLVRRKLTLDSKLRFRCYPGIKCFTKCCSAIDLMLTPYDVLRLKNRLGLGSEEFLERYTWSKVDEKSGHPQLFLKMNEDEESRCVFVSEEGCEVYSDRPVMCRYYPVGQAVHRKESEGELINEEFYVLVKEDHCFGFEEDREWTIAEWREDQEAEHYDEMNREWKDVLMRKRSFGETLDEKQQAQFYIASYDLDRFRRFVLESSFLEIFEVDEETVEKLKRDDLELMDFAFKYLKYLFGMEEALKARPEAVEARQAHKKGGEQAEGAVDQE
jgi:Fe-S-cluster containining protein